MSASSRCFGIVFFCGMLGCSPTFDWREASPQATGVAALFPCRPDQQSRSVTLADAQVEMGMLVCAAGGATFALSFVDVGDPSRVAPALAALRAAALAHFANVQPRQEPLRISGMTANSQAVRMTLDGRLPDGTVLRQHAAFFARNLRVYQASVVGTKPAAEAVDTFFAGLRFPA